VDSQNENIRKERLSGCFSIVIAGTKMKLNTKGSVQMGVLKCIQDRLM